MAFGYLKADRDQLFLLPVDVRDWLPEGHLAWFVLDVVARLDTSALHARHPNDGPGRAAYDPTVLLGLLVYAYCTGTRSSRQVERLCEVDVAYRVICANRAPDHSTFARFRQAHDELAQSLFVQVLALCANAGLAKVGVVAIDGTKMGADASMGANRTLSQLQALVGEMFAEAERTDVDEDRLFGDKRGDELPEALAEPRSRAARIDAALAELKAQQAEKDDRDAKAGEAGEAAERAAAAAERLPQGRPPRGRELERAVVALSVARERAIRRRQGVEERWAAWGKKLGGVTPDVEKDRYVKRARRRLAKLQAAHPDKAPTSARQRKVNLTDIDSRLMMSRQGYVQAYNAQAGVNEQGLVLVAEVAQDANDLRQLVPMLSSLRANLDAAGVGEQIGTALFDAGYWSERNATAEGPDRLIATTKSWKLRNKARSEGYTTGPVPLGASPAQAMEHRLCSEEGSALYSKRAVTVEPVFGQHKAVRGYRRFSRRGYKAVQAEWKLMNTAHNLLKLFNADRLPAALPLT